ncbi:MAG: protein kinase [Acidobacteria bacterium]|nr:protein kinase [Acidobacteriota bacterium]
MVTCANLNCIYQWSTSDSHCPKCQSLHINALVGYRYKIKKILGKGGFSITYLVEDLDCLREVKVLKQLRRIFNNNEYDQESNETAGRLFKREAEVLLKLQHPGIPKLYAYFIDEGYSYLVQDFIPGHNLAEEVIERNYSFDEQEARLFLTELADILDYLHTHNPVIIHRDIKPENLMRHEDGKLLLIDFGAVCQMVGTTNQTLIYSPGYTAPEQIAGETIPQSDLYSAGATTLRLLASDSTIPSIKPREGQWESFIAVSPEFAAIINDLLIPDINKRLKSASELKWRLQLLPALPQVIGNPISPFPQYSFKKSYSQENNSIYSPTLFSGEQPSNTTIELGELKDQPFLFLLQRIFREQLSGSLVCTKDKINKSIVFYQGNVISANSTEIIDQLDDLLIRTSQVAARTFAEAKKEMSETTCSFSDALIRLNAVSEKQLNALKKIQISQIVTSLFSWTVGQYELRCETYDISSGKISIPVANLIFEGLRSLDSTDLLKSWLGDFSRQLIPNPTPSDLTKFISLTSKEVFVFSRVTVTTTIAEVLSLDCLPEIEMLRAICGLIAVGLLNSNIDEKKIDRSVDSVVKLLKELRSGSKACDFQSAAAFCYEVESIIYDLDNTSYYTLLGTQANAKDIEIREAYEKAVKKFHPASNEDFCRYNPSLHPQLEKLFSHILIAYRVLKNPFSRKQYDKSLKINSPILSFVKKMG